MTGDLGDLGDFGDFGGVGEGRGDVDFEEFGEFWIFGGGVEIVRVLSGFSGFVESESCILFERSSLANIVWWSCRTRGTSCASSLERLSRMCCCPFTVVPDK